MNCARFIKRKSSSEASSLTVQQGVMMAALFVALATTLQATQPAWWNASGAVNASAGTNDYMVVNQGQLKQFTQKAVQYLNTNLAGGAGTTLDSMVAGWSNYYATNGYSSTNPAPQDFQAVNQGQLKYIAGLVWTQLMYAGYTNTIPSWIVVNTNSDYIVANAGQLKTVFNFDLTGDSDGNGLPDWWEMQYFGGTGAVTGYTTNSSPDGNGLTLLQDYQQGNDPTNYYSQGGTTIVPTVSIVSGNNQTNSPGAFTEMPLVVSVVNSSDGTALTNAPVSFAVTAGGGGLGINWGDLSTTSRSVTTDVSGQAQVYYQSGTGNNISSTIVASSGGQTVSFSSTTSSGDGTFDAPSDMTMTPVSPTQINLTWVNHATSATGIVIDKSTDNVNWTRAATLTDPTTTHYGVTGLTVGQSYYFRIAGSK